MQSSRLQLIEDQPECQAFWKTVLNFPQAVPVTPGAVCMSLHAVMNHMSVCTWLSTNSSECAFV